MSVKRLKTPHSGKSLSLQKHHSVSMRSRPSCVSEEFIMDFQMEILQNFQTPNVTLEYGPKSDLLESNDHSEITNSIRAIWTKHRTLLNKIHLWSHFWIITISIILSLILPNAIIYFIFMHYGLDNQADNSCTQFTFYYEIGLTIIIGFVVVYLRVRSYYFSLIAKWKNHFVNQIVLLIHSKLSCKYADFEFQCIFPIKVRNTNTNNQLSNIGGDDGVSTTTAVNKPQTWCYLRVLDTGNHFAAGNVNKSMNSTAYGDRKQPVFTTSSIFTGETHLVMDFDLYLKDDMLGVNIVNGRKRHEFNEEYPDNKVIEMIGKYIISMKIPYKTCILRCAWLSLIFIFLAILSMPWVICTAVVADIDDITSEIIIIVSVTGTVVFSFVFVAFFVRRCLYWKRKTIFMDYLTDFMKNTLSKKYVQFAFSIVYPAKGQLWCQFRISDHVLKCRNDEQIHKTTYHENSVSIRTKSIGANAAGSFASAKSPLLVQ